MIGGSYIVRDVEDARLIRAAVSRENERVCHGKESSPDDFFFNQLHVRLPFTDFQAALLRELNVASKKLHLNA